MNYFAIIYTYFCNLKQICNYLPVFSSLQALLRPTNFNWLHVFSPCILVFCIYILFGLLLLALSYFTFYIIFSSFPVFFLYFYFIFGRLLAVRHRQPLLSFCPGKHPSVRDSCIYDLNFCIFAPENIPPFHNLCIYDLNFCIFASKNIPPVHNLCIYDRNFCIFALENIPWFTIHAFMI